MRSKFLLSMLFVYALAGAFLLFAANHVYALWSGGFALWPIALPALTLGGAAGWGAHRWGERFVGPRVLALLATLAAAMAAFTLGNLAGMVHDWTFLSLRIGLTYEAWRAFVWGQAALWVAPLAFLFPLLWVRGNAIAPRGRLTVFVGVCVGMILARIFVGALPIGTLIQCAALVALVAAVLGTMVAFARLWSRIALALPALLLVATAAVFAYANHLPTEKLEIAIEDVNPFAPIAARDSVYTGQGTEGVTLLEGRLVRAAGIDEAALTASQFIPFLLKPAPNARIAARPAVGAPLFPSCEAGQLKGLYDALWVELPPAWVGRERDYFGSAALSAALENLNEGGVLVYDLDARALDARMLMARIGILLKHFPHVQLWMTGLNRWQLVASRKPIVGNLAEMTALLDRANVALVLIRSMIDAPITLLPCCMVADAKTLESALAEPIAPRIPLRSAIAARRLLFDGRGAQHLVAQFAPLYDAKMDWVALPKETEAAFRDVIATLRQARRLVLQGKYIEASKINPNDPVLRGLSDREIASADAFEKLADHENALRAYASAFALAKPAVGTVFKAAEIARATGKPGRAAPFLRLAESLAPEDPNVLFVLADFHLAEKDPKQAERHATRALREAAKADAWPDAIPRIRLVLATAIARQEGRVDEGLAIARQVAAQAKTQAEKDVFIPAYADLLIESGRAVQGVAVKRHYQAYHELLPAQSPTQSPKQEAKP